MGMYRVEWDCCGGVTETDSYLPERCPICERDDLRARERICPTMLEAEARALMRAVQAVATHVGLGMEASPQQIVDAVGSMAARLAEIERQEPVAFFRASDAEWLAIGRPTVVYQNPAEDWTEPLYTRPTPAAAPAQADESPTPSGWKVVPVEPTPEMVNAADSIDWYNGDTRASVVNMWQCMLATAPEPDDPADLLRSILGTEVARGTLYKLRDGQGIDTTSGRAWMAAFAWAGESLESDA